MPPRGKHDVPSVLTLPNNGGYESTWRRVTSIRKSHLVLLAAFIVCVSYVGTSKSVLHNCSRLWLGSAQYDFEAVMKATFRDDTCPQSGPLVPHSNIWGSLSREYLTDEFRIEVAELLGGAVRIPTPVYEDMGPVGTDPRWDNFTVLEHYLQSKFKLVQETLEMTPVNTHGLLYVWEGSDETLKPLLLMAHQDVVPVDDTTAEQWEYDPFSGYDDGVTVWGRGSVDDKGSLISILTSVEMLISKGFEPTRTLVLSFGFDEEISGKQGASHIAEYLLNQYGEDSFAMIVDEGAGIIEQMGTALAVPGIVEKGYLDVRIEVTSQGGHSSVPPSHTSIGMLSALLVQYEDNPFIAQLRRDSPFFSILECIAEHAPQIDDYLRDLIKAAQFSDKALESLEALVVQHDVLRAMISTTQSINVIRGGFKANALPKTSHALVNHRIDIHSNVHEVKHRDAHLLLGLAYRFNVSYAAFGEQLYEGNKGLVNLTEAFDSALEPSPETPSSSDSAAFQLLSGTIKAAYSEFRREESGAKDVIVAPGLMPANTDTKYFWDLSKNIFRYSHLSVPNGVSVGVHGVNEGVPVRTLAEGVLFYTTLILNADEATDL